MTKEVGKILSEIKKSVGTNIKFEPFLNTYFWTTDLGKTSVLREVHFNNSPLIIDEPGKQSEAPYLLECGKRRLALLLEYFSAYPIHQINRIALDISRNPSERMTYMSMFEELISKHIMPKIIVTFSKKVSKAIRKTFEVKLENRLGINEGWSGIYRIGSGYFYVYCLPDIDRTNFRRPEISRFMKSSIAFDFQVCKHLNAILEKSPGFQFPDYPLDNQKVRKCLLQLKNLDYPGLLSLHGRKNISELIKLIPDFNEFDILAAQYLFDGLVKNEIPPLKMSQYIKMRKRERAESIYRKYLEGKTIQGLYTLKLALIHLYLFVQYPQESYDFRKDEKWGVTAWEMRSESKRAFECFRKAIES